jgi:cell division septation protein DedD
VRNTLFVAALAAIVVVVFTSVRAYGRAGWYMALDNDQVTLFQGREEGVLWVKPAARRTYPVTRTMLTKEWQAKLDAHIPFTTRAAAEQWFALLYVNPDAVDRGTTTTTTTTTVATTTTTTVATTTTTAPSTTTATAPPTDAPTAAPTTVGA